MVERTSRRTALVTGATAGIGAAFARRLAAEGYALVLVARDEARLAAIADELADRYGVTATPQPADLSTDEGCARVETRLRDVEAPIELLVNNAGGAVNTDFVRSTVDDQEWLLRLNIHSVMRLTLAALPGMVDRGRGDVINVSSVAGFGTPRPGSTYSATKAWVTNFSESVGLSVRRRGVRVMALCPGFTRTEFHQRAKIETGSTPAWAWLDADVVARDALRDLRRDRLVSVPDWKYKTAVFGMRYLPRRLLQRAARRAIGQSTPKT